MVKKILLFGLLSSMVAVYILFRVFSAYALTLNFQQTDWSGGADESTTIDDTHLTDWNKYYSKDDNVGLSKENGC